MGEEHRKNEYLISLWKNEKGKHVITSGCVPPRDRINEALKRCTSVDIKHAYKGIDSWAVTLDPGVEVFEQLVDKIGEVEGIAGIIVDDKRLKEQIELRYTTKDTSKRITSLDGIGEGELYINIEGIAIVKCL